MMTSARSRFGRVPTLRSSLTADTGLSPLRDSLLRMTVTTTRTQDPHQEIWVTRDPCWLKTKTLITTEDSKHNFSQELTETGKLSSSSLHIPSWITEPRDHPMERVTAASALVTNATDAPNLWPSPRLTIPIHAVTTVAATVAGSRVSTPEPTEIRPSSTQ